MYKDVYNLLKDSFGYVIILTSTALLVNIQIEKGLGFAAVHYVKFYFEEEHLWQNGFTNFLKGMLI